MEDGCSAAAESHFLFLELEGSEKPLLNIIISHAEQQPYFLVLPGQNVAIYPPPSMISQIGDNVLDIDYLLAETEKHNQGLSTQQLIHFSKMLADLIATLITTVDEDTVILQQMNDNLRMMILSQDISGEIEQLMDIVSAISYRIQFKQSIRTALDATNQVLSIRNEPGEL